MQALNFPNPIVAQQPVRIRLSCDSCSAAKVKCDKRRPACKRCSSNHMQCIYSISRRHGCKRKVGCEPALNTHGAAQVPQQSLRGGEGASASATERQGHGTVGFSTFDNHEVSGNRTANEDLNFYNGNDIANLFRSLENDDSTLSLDVDGSRYPSFTFDNAIPAPNDPPSSNYFPPDLQEPGQPPWISLPTPSTTSVYGEDMRVSEDDVTLPAASETTQGASNGPIESNKSSNQATNSEKPREVHDCEAHALELLRSLHHWPLYSPDKHSEIKSNEQTCALEPCLDNGNTNPEVFHSLDTILYANKSALSGVEKLLDCSCVQRTHLATLYISIITKMLSLYEIAGTTDVGCASSASSTKSLSGPRLAHSLVIKAGVFELDDEDQATLQRGILLRQLDKMERVIDKLACLDSGDPKNHDISVRQWLSMAVPMLKKELRRVYRNCKEKLLVYT